ncbi:MAG: HAD-IIIA family hydrolase [Actinobacteria bacterium]|nr:HAD-IIIA family hydrolase [Actinomycetota bacterium]
MSETTTGSSAVFLDRDGTLVHESLDYIIKPEDLELIDGVGQALRRLRAAGYKLVVITNQACLAKGILEEKTLEQIHDRLRSLLAEEAVQLDGIYFCGHHPEGAVQKYAQDSDRRKPAPGMLLEAAEELDIDLGRSWMVGDATGDAQAGRRAGCRTIILTDPEQIAKGGPGSPDITAADFAVKNLSEAADVIISQDISLEDSDEQPSAREAKSPAAVPNDNARILTDILRELRHQRVTQVHREFSVSKMLAGMLQCTVFLCLVMAYVAFSYWTEKSLYVCLAVGLILQTMVVALLLLHPSR